MDHTDEQQLASNTQSLAGGGLSTGTILDGKFRIGSYIGGGGMGAVFSATHLKLGNQVAIKVLHSRFAVDQNAVARFHREAKIIAGLHHKNILSVYAFGSADGLLYMAMELVDGKSLGDLIAQHGSYSPERAIPLLLQICDAMSYAHQQKVLHRDLKPDNVLVTNADDTAKVVDFGLAKLTDAEMQRLTTTGMVVGDPRYMSPEQSQGKPVDARSDIYSFGCLMYEMLAGRRPFDADTPVAILFKQISEYPESFADQTNISLSLQAIAFQALQKDPQARYQSIDDLSSQLLKLSRNPDAKVEGVRAGGTPTQSRSTTGSRAARQHALKMLIGALLVVGAITVGMVIIGTSTRLSNEEGLRASTRHEVRLEFDSLISNQGFVGDQNPTDALERAQILVAQYPEEFNSSDRAKLDLVQALNFERLGRYREPDKIKLAQTHNKGAISQLETALKVHSDHRRQNNMPTTDAGMEPWSSDSRYLFEALLLQSRLADRTGDLKEMRSAIDSLLSFAEKYELPYTIDRRLLREACERLIMAYGQANDRQAAEQVLQRFMNCLATQGDITAFTDNDERLLRDTMEKAFDKQKHHPN